MAIAETVLRILTVYALKGATLAGDQVLDDPGDPAEAADTAAAPLLAVFTGRAIGQVDGTDLIGQDLELDLTVQSYIPAGVTVEAAGKPISIDVRGSGGSLALGVLERQIIRALLAGKSPWCEAWRDLVLSISESTGQNFFMHRGEGDAQVRMVAREITLRLAPLADPPLGGPLPEPYLVALELMRGVAGLEPIVAWIEAEAAGPEGLHEWQRQQAELGTTRRGIAGLGLAPADRPADFPAVPFEGFTVGTDPDNPDFSSDAPEALL